MLRLSVALTMIEWDDDTLNGRGSSQDMTSRISSSISLSLMGVAGLQQSESSMCQCAVAVAWPRKDGQGRSWLRTAG